MRKQSMKVAVIGVGAIGGPVAAHIAENQFDITVVTKYPDLAKLIQTKGIKLQGLEKERYVPIKAVPSINQLEGKFDIVFLAMKAMDACGAAEALLPYLMEDSVVVTLQNGVVEEEIARITKPHRVIGAVVAWASKMIKPGAIERTSDGAFYIGSLGNHENKNRLREVKHLLEYLLPTTVTENIFGALYAKLGINAGINGLGALSGLAIGEIVDNERYAQLFMGIMKELFTIAEKENIEVFQLNEAYHPRDITLSDTDSPSDIVKKHMLLKRIFEPYRAVKSSTLRSLERGQRSEIDFINGFIARKGTELGVLTPINVHITQLIKEIETGEREIIPSNLDEL
ncbi:2-dehydropantoate 2-reductase [Candidatus Heimdallarchaeota archaeon B3_Heim]|nr:MAG: 2-dehydropantoate 2-reductase [Candidatus Heimdallarchaeota archaeon B3_Heim]